MLVPVAWAAGKTWAKVPGGLEEMFFELGNLSKNAIRDPAVRRAISDRYDSVPV